MNWTGLHRRLRQAGVLWVLLTCAAAQTEAQDLTKLATDLATRIHAAKHSRVTVLDFLDLDKKTTKLGKLLAFKLQAALSEPDRGLEVVDQTQIAQLFDQMQKLSEGLIDPATGQQVGKIAGIEVLIVGTVMVSENSVKLDVKGIDLQTAKMIAAGSASTVRVGLVDRLAKEAEKEEPESASADEEDGSDTPAATKKSGRKSLKAPPRIKRDQSVVFELAGCSLSGDALTCSVNVTSEGRDRWLAVALDSQAWNESGDENHADDIVISNSRFQRGQAYCATKEVLKNVPTHLALTFPTFGDASIVERMRLFWLQTDEASRWCPNGMRPVDFEKIAISDDADFSSPQTAAHSGGGKGGGNSAGSGKKSGGILGKLLGKAEEVAEKIIDKKAKKLTGEDEEEDDSEKPPQR